jgi:hypothetical protein
MVFPRPVTARRVVRTNIARNLSDIGNLYAELLTGVEEEAEEEYLEGEKVTKRTEAGGAVEKTEVRRRVEKYRGSFVQILVRHIRTYETEADGL